MLRLLILLFIITTNFVEAAPKQCEKGYVILKLSKDLECEIGGYDEKANCSMYLVDSKGNKIALYPIKKLPDELLGDVFEGKYMQVSSVAEIETAYGGDCTFFCFDLPEIIYISEGDAPCPIFDVLRHKSLEDPLKYTTCDDLYWSTGKWFGFTQESSDNISIIFPRYEVKWKKKNIEVLNELLLLPPDKEKGFPGGAEYLKIKDHFEKMQNHSQQ